MVKLSTKNVYDLQQQITDQTRTVIEKLELKERINLFEKFKQTLWKAELPTKRKKRFAGYQKKFWFGKFGHFHIKHESLYYLGHLKCSPSSNFLCLDGEWLDEFNNCFETAVQYLTEQFNLELK